MNSSQQIRPCRPHNSIEMMGFNVVFCDDESIISKDFAEQLSNNKYFSSLFDSIQYIESEPGSNQSAIHLVKKTDSCENEWLVRLSSNSINIFNRDYTRWKYCWDFCLGLLTKFNDIYFNKKVDTLLLGYLDAFYVSDHADFECSQIYKKNKLIPDIIFENTYINVKTGYPYYVEDIDESAWLDVSLSAKCKDKKNEIKLICNTSATIFFDETKYGDLLENSGHLASKYASCLHVLLKNIFKDIIVDSVLEKVGIKEE